MSLSHCTAPKERDSPHPPASWGGSPGQSSGAPNGRGLALSRCHGDGHILPLPSTSSSPPRPVLSASGSLEIKPARPGGPTRPYSPDSREQRTPNPTAAHPGPHPIGLQLFPLAQAAEEGLLLPAQRLPGGQEHRAPHVEPHPLAPAAHGSAACPRRRRCLPSVHPHRSPRRLHPTGSAAGGGQVPRAGHAGSCSPPRRAGEGCRSCLPSATYFALAGRPTDLCLSTLPLATLLCV